MRKVKGLLLLTRSDIWLGWLAFPFEFLAQISRLSRWIRKNPPTYTDDFYTSSIDLDRRYDLYKTINEKEIKNEAITYLEFGVASGRSFKWWVKENTNPDSRFVGFDTFTGLPEDWGPYKKGAMSAGDKPPEIDDKRVSWEQGLFQQKLPEFIANNSKPTQKLIIHLDADLYTATLYALTTLYPWLKKGDIIFFDEFNVPLHEFKAFDEFVRSFYFEYEVLAAVNNYYQIGIKVK